jgi:nucleotide-binding universal stress UspA family protein
MKKIIIPIDFSLASEKAVRYVENVFKNQPVELELIYVSPEFSEDNDHRVKEAYKTFDENVLKSAEIPYHFHNLKGNLLAEIQKAIHLYNPAFVIMGTTKASLAKALVKLTDCPIVVIPENNTKSKITKIAYANDFNNIKVSTALEPLLILARSFGAKVYIIHVCKDKSAINDNAEEVIEYYLNHIDHEYVCINSDNIVSSIQNYIAEQKIDLLSILIRDHGNNALKSNGTLVEQLVSNTKVPLLNLI